MHQLASRSAYALILGAAFGLSTPAAAQQALKAAREHGCHRPVAVLSRSVLDGRPLGDDEGLYSSTTVDNRIQSLLRDNWGVEPVISLIELSDNFRNLVVPQMCATDQYRTTAACNDASTFADAALHAIDDIRYAVDSHVAAAERLRALENGGVVFVAQVSIDRAPEPPAATESVSVTTTYLAFDYDSQSPIWPHDATPYQRTITVQSVDDMIVDRIRTSTEREVDAFGMQCAS